jgi:hypothetical protein
MAGERKNLHAHLSKLAHLLELARRSQGEDRARMERSIRLVIRALQMIARQRQRTQSGMAQREASEFLLVCRLLAEQARVAGLRIADNDN